MRNGIRLGAWLLGTSLVGDLFSSDQEDELSVEQGSYVKRALADKQEFRSEAWAEVEAMAEDDPAGYPLSEDHTRGLERGGRVEQRD